MPSTSATPNIHLPHLRAFFGAAEEVRMDAEVGLSGKIQLL
jgi:hypothetical protein